MSVLIQAQPSNDECAMAINLGNAPVCNNTFYTNVAATASDIGAGNIPSCFNVSGGMVQRDVWFQFTTDATIKDYDLIITGAIDNGSEPMMLPQVALYRGNCGTLDELFCASAAIGTNTIKIEALDLLNNTTYFFRVNDYSTTAAPNAGTFQVCVREFVPEFNMGEQAMTTECVGTLFDSGGPNGVYANSENHTFQICPSDAHQCISLFVNDFDIEEEEDFLKVYEGADTNAPLIAVLTGTSSGADFQIQATSDCVTLAFNSDGFVSQSGFEIDWECSAAACDLESLDNVSFIPSLPYNVAGLSTCDNASTFATAGTCPDVPFLGGPEKVFTYNSAGGECISVMIGNADDATGVLILNAAPDDPDALCINVNKNGTIASANLQTAGTYYIVVANNLGCTDFDIVVSSTDCNIGASLANVICHPINNCATRDPVNGMPLPTTLFFEDGFQDIDIRTGINNGCWDLSIGLGLDEPNFYWFSFEALQDGQFGFIIQSVDVASDLDFSVWGPFSNDEICNDRNAIVNFVLNNQPIRSSYSGGPEPTGLVNVHPETGEAVTDDFDCSPRPGPNGDDFARVIDVNKGEVYIVLLNDWQDNIQSNGIKIDWSPTTANTLLPDPPEIIKGDTAICKGDVAQLEITSELTSIVWSPAASLTCTNCLNPIASPTQTTTYQAVISSACRIDTLEMTVRVFEIDAGADREVCLNESFQIIAGEEFSNATYQWTDPGGFLSCTDCPDPEVNATAPGTYEIIVQLTAGNCLLKDTMILTVRNEQAPQFTIIEDAQICRGDFINIGGAPGAGVNYTWTSSPAGFNSNANNPSVNPNEKTTYYISATNALCPLATIDSVVIDVSTPPIIDLADDFNICEGDTVILANNIPSPSVSYQWNPSTDLDNDTIPNPTAVPKTTTTYTLEATRGACVVTDNVKVSVTEIESNIMQDSISLCLGDTASIFAAIRPFNATSVWTPAEALSTTTGNAVLANPTDDITYYLEVTVPGCVRVDSVFVEVDSLPADLSILPQDTTICQGSTVILVSPTYDPVYYPDIDFLWIPSTGQLTGDSLYNLVVQPNDTTTYSRITTNGACVDTSMTTVNVKPITIITVDPPNPTICQGQSVDLQITNTDNLEELEWMPPTGLSCTDCLNPTASPQSTIQYMITAEVDGCPAQGMAVVNVLPDPSLPRVTGTVCQGATINLNPGGNPAFTYTWSASPADPTLGDVTASSPIVTPTQNTTYTVTIDNGVCDPVTTSIAVEVIGDQTLELTDDLKLCLGDEAILNASGSSAGRYFWTVAGDNTVISTDPTLSLLIATTTTFEVTFEYGPASSPCGSIVKQVTVTVLGSFDVDIQANPNASTISQGQEVTLSAITSPSLPNGTYTWTDQNGAVVGNGQNITLTPTNIPTATYTVTATSADGCTNSATISFTVIPPTFSIPNAFTPDGDDVNDIFKLIYSGNIQLISFQIFDRRGSLVFETTNIDEGWDGNKNGKKMPSEVYVYLIRLNLPTGEEILKGDVTLIR